MSNLYTCVFSKDRPLQLKAYLDSLFYYSGIQQNQTYVILPSLDEYSGFKEMYPEIMWIQEKETGGLNKAFRHLIQSLPNHLNLLFGCDDIIFTRFFNTNFIPELLYSMPDVLGFSLRLGTNLSCHPCPNKPADGTVLKFRWVNSPSHYGWPFDLMGTVYNVKLVKELLDYRKDPIRVPNDIESSGYYFCYDRKLQKQPNMAMFNMPGCLIAADMNKIQTLYDNKVQGAAGHSIDELKEIYKSGKRIQWQNYFGIEPKDMFIGDQYFSVA